MREEQPGLGDGDRCVCVCVCLHHCKQQVIGCTVHDSINRSYAIETVTPWALGEPKTASCISKKQRESSRGPASKQESKFWVQAATHGRLAMGTRGEERMGIRLRICLMRKITEKVMMGRAMAAGHGEHGRLSGRLSGMDGHGQRTAK